MEFEVYTQEANLTSELWHKLIYAITRHLSLIDTLDLTVTIDETNVSFHLGSKKDLSKLSSELVPFILKSVKETVPEEKPVKKLRWVNLGKLGNLLQIKDKVEFKKGKRLYRVVFSFRKILFYSYCKADFYFTTALEEKYKKSKLYFDQTPYSLLDIDFTKSGKYRKKDVPLFLKIQAATHLFKQEGEENMLEVLGFPFLQKPTYISLDSFDFDKHSLIVGQTGTGKSKYLELFIKKLQSHELADEYSIIVLDPHAVIYRDFISSTKQAATIDFYRNACNLFPTEADPKIATDLTMLLFKTLMKDQFNPKMEQVLKYSLYVLYLTKQMTITNLRRLLTELEFRKSVVNTLDNESLIKFFDTDFNELKTKYYELSIMPILTLLDELNFLPFQNFEQSHPLENVITNYPLTFLSLNQMMLGQKATKLIAGLLIQQIFMIAQSGSFPKKIILIIDELSIVENEAIAAILSEARKFNLSLILTQQYLTQIDPSLLKSIITNAYNYFVFKVAQEDANLLANNLEMEFTEEMLIDAKNKGLKEHDLKMKMITTLNSRECLTRLFKDEKFYSCVKSKTLDV